MKDLASRSLSAVLWGAGGSVLRIALQFGCQVVLARLLGPEQYGLFAIGTIVVGFSAFFADIGIAYGLIQKKDVVEQDLRFVVTWQLLIGLGVTALVFVFSDAIAAFFGDARARDVVASLAVICLLNALAAPALNMLKRNLDFRRLQQAQLISYVVGYLLVGIPMAWAGARVWALVTAWIVQAGCSTLLLYAFHPHPLRPLIWFPEASAQFRYGATVLSTNLANWLTGNLDRVVVGRFFPSAQIGLYATSYSMLYSVTAAILGVVQPVFFSASARLEQDRRRMAAAYLGLLSLLGVTLVPMFVGLATVAETFTLAVYGAAWRDLASTLRPLALAMPIFLFWGLTTPLLWTAGDVTRELRLQLPLAAVWLAVSAGAAQFSPAAVAWAVFGLFCLRFGLMFRAAGRLLALSVRDLWRVLRGGLGLAFAIALALRAIDALLGRLAVPALPSIALQTAVGALVLLGSLRFVPGLLSRDAAPMLDLIARKLPDVLARQLRAVPLKQESST